MVQRYQQDKLPSRVVGTPGVDPSAGKAAAEVAGFARESTANAFNYAEGQFNRASGMYSRAGAEFNAAGAYAQQSLAAFQAKRSAQQAMQTDLAFALKKPELDAQLNSMQDATTSEIDAASQKDPTAPYQAGNVWGKKATDFLQSVTNDTTLSPALKKKIVPYLSQAITTRQDQFHTGAPQWVNNNIDAGLKAAPAKAQGVLDQMDISQDVGSQARQTASTINDYMSGVKALREQSKLLPPKMAQEKIASIDAESLKTAQHLSATGINGMLAGIAPTPDGLNRIAALRQLVLNPEKNGLTLTNETKLSVMDKLNQMENLYAEKAAAIQQDHNLIAEANINNEIIYPMQRAEVENDPIARAQYQAKADAKMQELSGQLKIAEAMPPGPLRSKTILGIKTQQGQLIGGSKTLLSEADKFRSAQQQYTANELRDIQNKLSEMGMQFSLNQQQEGQQRDIDRNNAAAQEYSFLQESNHVASMPVGPARKAAAQELAAKVSKYTDWAVSRGLLNPGTAAAVHKQYGLDVLMKSEYQDHELFGQHWYTPMPSSTAKQRENLTQQTAADQEKILEGRRNDGTRLEGVLKNVGKYTLDDMQQLALSENLLHNYLPALEKQRSKGLKPQEEEAWTNAYFNALMKKAQSGQLPEQIKAQQLNLARTRPSLTGKAPPPPKGLPAQPAGAEQGIKTKMPKEQKLTVPPPPDMRALPMIGISGLPEGYNGNIDITQRQIVEHKGGKLDESNSTPAARKQYGNKKPGDYGTENSTRVTLPDGSQVSIPTIFDGKVHSDQEAVDHFRKTGQYLGKFPKGTPDSVMEDYEKRVHSRKITVAGKLYTGPQ